MRRIRWNEESEEGSTRGPWHPTKENASVTVCGNCSCIIDGTIAGEPDDPCTCEDVLLVRADLSDLDLDAAARPLHHWLGLWNPEWDDEQYEIIARAVVRAALGTKVNP